MKPFPFKSLLITASLLCAGLFVSTIMVAMPMQGGLSTTSKTVKETAMSTKAESGAFSKNPVVARNTTAKPEVATIPPADQKDQDKKTIGRCWKRLMNMVREVSHAHRTKSNP
ncbi:hypothetical protein [Spirosoma sp.]|uniref:hypothetical protein n=1 Tax=Spirosoma sp. TaxID=1899569 RepID=UPI003B3A0584